MKYKCEKCEKEYTSKQGFQNHSCIPRKGLECPKCGYFYKRNRHICKKKKFKCNKCNRIFTTKQGLIIHKCYLPNELKCSKCGKQYKYHSYFMKHDCNVYRKTIIRKMKKKAIKKREKNKKYMEFMKSFCIEHSDFSSKELKWYYYKERDIIYELKEDKNHISHIFGGLLIVLMRAKALDKYSLGSWQGSIRYKTNNKTFEIIDKYLNYDLIYTLNNNKIIGVTEYV